MIPFNIHLLYESCSFYFLLRMKSMVQWHCGECRKHPHMNQFLHSYLNQWECKQVGKQRGRKFHSLAVPKKMELKERIAKYLDRDCLRRAKILRVGWRPDEGQILIRTLKKSWVNENYAGNGISNMLIHLLSYQRPSLSHGAFRLPKSYWLNPPSLLSWLQNHDCSCLFPWTMGFSCLKRVQNRTI